MMTQAGLSRELIIRKIKVSKGKYDTSAQNLIELKKAGVSDEIIALMMDEKCNSDSSEKYTENNSQFANKTEAKIDAQYIVLEPKQKRHDNRGWRNYFVGKFSEKSRASYLNQIE